MKYLLDSSILLEGLLLQARAQEVHDLLSRAEAGELCLTDLGSKFTDPARLPIASLHATAQGTIPL